MFLRRVKNLQFSYTPTFYEEPKKAPTERRIEFRRLGGSSRRARWSPIALIILIAVVAYAMWYLRKLGDVREEREAVAAASTERANAVMAGSVGLLGH